MRSAPARGRRGSNPASTRFCKPASRASPQLRASGLARVGLSVPGRSLGRSPSVPKGHRVRRRRGRSGSPARPLLSRPADVRRLPARGPLPEPLTAGSCRDCAGCSARAACARTAWLGLRARPDPGARRTGRGATQPLGHLPAALLTAVAARPAHLWTAREAGPRPDPPPGRAAASPGDPHKRALPGSERASRAATASVQRGCGRGSGPALPVSRPRGWGPGNRPRSPGVFPLPEPHRGWGEEAVSLGI